MTEDVSSERDERAELHERVLLKIGWAKDSYEGMSPHTVSFWTHPDIGAVDDPFDVEEEGGILNTLIVQMIEWLLEKDCFYLAKDTDEGTYGLYSEFMCPSTVKDAPTLANALACAVDAVEEKPE